MKINNITTMEKRIIEIIDQVVEKIVLPYSTLSKKETTLKFAKIFSHKKESYISHYLDKFIYGSKNDWGLYMLSVECQIVREFLEYHSIPIEEDKITDKIEIVKAQLSGKNRFEIFPFEYEVIRMFYLFANNHSLNNIDEWTKSEEIKIKLEKAKISLYGNGINWSKAWTFFNDDDKINFVTFLQKKE